jgi:pyruvate/2-oxoglutarate dehydrogenase complex dihydrolipoamide acyltransferase (E2) component
MRRAIVVPEVGFPAPLLSLWYARPGEHVYVGDRVAELLLGSATFDVAAPCSGRLIERTARPADRVTPGQVLGYLEEDPE